MTTPASSPPTSRPPCRWSWGALALLLSALGVAALGLDRSQWPSLPGDEATYLMQAESLAWDLDLRYTRADFDRFVEHRQRPPQGLILQSGDGGATITYGKPFFYALYLAPFLRLAPQRGGFVGNVALLAAACLWAAWVLHDRVGRHAPLWVATYLFASVAFVYAFWIHADLFLLCATAIAVGLLVWRDRQDPRGTVRWAVAGMLLGMVVFSRPVYAPLFAAALIPLLRQRRRRALLLLLAGATLLVAVSAGVHQLLAGSWTSYGAERLGFYVHTGFPEVDFPATSWGRNIGDWGDHAWGRTRVLLSGDKLVGSLWGWNTAYFLLGRHVGLLPYFLPLALAFLGRPRGWLRWSLLGAVALSVIGFLWLRPFNFYGGGGAVANRYFLPLYPALWYLPTRPLRLRWLGLVAVSSGLFLAPLWRHPSSYPLYSEGRFPHVSVVAERLLPYETTQSHLKALDRDDVYPGLFIRFVDANARPGSEGSTMLIRAGRETTLLVGRPGGLSALEVEVLGEGGGTLEASGASIEPGTEGRSPRRYRLRLGTPRARHPMWWTWDPVTLHFVTLRVDEGSQAWVPIVVGAPPEPSDPPQL